MTVANNDRPELFWRGIDDVRRASSPSGNKDASRASRFRRMIFTLLALFLVWEVITRSVAAYLADARPEMAIRLRATNPTALLNLAEAELKREQAVQQADVTSPRNRTNHSASDLKDLQSIQDVDLSGERSSTSVSKRNPPEPANAGSQDRAQIRSWAELVLRNDPLNARAFGILGQLSQQASDEEQTEPLMRAAARRSLHETGAVYWMMHKSYQDGDYDAAIRYADTLLRTRTGVAEHVMPILGKIAENEDASGDLKHLLAGNPPWRRGFFDRLPSNISDARTPLEILLTLKNTLIPPTAADLRSYLDFLIRRGFYEIAYYTWLQFLPAEQLSKVGLLYNGGFEVAPSGLPFNWVFSKGSGVTIKLEERPDKEGENALLLEFGVVRVDLPRIKQLILLAPGRYRFQGKHNVDVVSQRGLQWRITCAGKGATQIGESRIAQGSGAAWQDFSFSFTVPETDCAAQHLQLVFDARWASERFISGSIWYDELQIEREPAVTP